MEVFCVVDVLEYWKGRKGIGHDDGRLQERFECRFLWRQGRSLRISGVHLLAADFIKLVMRRSRKCNVDANKMVQHKVKRIVGRCNLMLKGLSEFCSVMTHLCSVLGYKVQKF
ncbi:unnamed protein product [Rhodiola kirilowii]